MVSPYTQHNNSQLSTVQPAHKTPLPTFGWCHHIQHINWQLSTVQPAHTTPPPPLGWCHHTHRISTRNSVECNQHTKHHYLRLDGVTIYSKSTGNSVQCNQHTQHHHLPLDGVTIYTAYQLANQHSATSTHNTTTSPWMVSPYTQYINSQLITVQPAHTTPPPLVCCHHIHSISTGNSVQYNQHTQHHHLRLDGVTIYTAYQLQGEKIVFISFIYYKIPKINSLMVSLTSEKN